MKLATCICGEHGSVNVSGEGYGRTFTRGMIVDLNEKVAPRVETTWGEAIGEAYAHLFDSPKSAAAREVRREESAEIAEAHPARGGKATRKARE